MTTMTTKNKQQKSFTLNELIANIDLMIKQSRECVAEGVVTLVASHITQAPSMPTIKNWSKSGFFKAANDLNEATRLALERMGGRSRYYATRSGHPLESSDRPAASNPTGSQTGLMEQILDELRQQRERINGIEKYMSNAGSIVDNSGPATVETTAALAKVTNAIAQLDLFRKNMMLRFDNEVQLVKQAGAGQRQFESASALDMQRMVIKISKLEELLKTKITSK